MVRIAGLAALVVVAAAIAAPAQQIEEHDSRHIEASQVGPFRPVEKPDLARVAGLIVEQTNRFRQAEKREPVRAADHLKQASQYFASYMARTDDYGHMADGKRPADRAKAHGYDFCILSENIAYQFRTSGFATEKLAEVFVTGWKESPGHRRNMLDPDVTETGVAVAQSEKTGVFYAVQMFGRPQSESIDFKVANRTNSTVQYRLGDQKFELPPAYVQRHRVCRPAPLSLEPREADRKSTASAVKPKAGESYAIQASAEGKLELSRVSQPE